jgi:hypothetical protein
MVANADAKELAKTAGADIDLGDADYPQDTLQLLIDRSAARRNRQEVVTSSGIGWGTQIGAGLASGIADPINLALAFTPAAPAALTARIALAETTLSRAAARGAVGAVEGAVGAGIAESPSLPPRASRKGRIGP